MQKQKIKKILVCVIIFGLVLGMGAGFLFKSDILNKKKVVGEVAGVSDYYSDFELRKLNWINRNGRMENGQYYQPTSVSLGCEHVFAWLENNKRRDSSGLISSDFDEVSEIIDQLVKKSMSAGTHAGLTLIRLLMQYENEIGESNVNKILDLYQQRAVRFSGMSSRAVQIQALAEMYLYLYYYDQDVSFRYYNDSANKELDPQSFDCYNCSNKRYSENFSNSYSFVRDKLLDAMRRLVKLGDNELDGHYTNLALESLLAVYDFAEEEDVKRQAKMSLDVLVLDTAMEYTAGQKGGTWGRSRYWNAEGRYVDTLMYPLFGLGPNKYNQGAYYVSSYRPNKIIQDLVHINAEQPYFWEVHQENNGAGSGYYGKWTYITPYYSVGTAVNGPKNNGQKRWQITFPVNYTKKEGDSALRFWLDKKEQTAESGGKVSDYNEIILGTTGCALYKDAFVCGDIPYEHFILNSSGIEIKNKQELEDGSVVGILKSPGFDIGNNKLKCVQGDGYSGGDCQLVDRNADDNFFKKGNVAFYIKHKEGNWPVGGWAGEITVLCDKCRYSTFDEFKNAVRQNSSLERQTYTTSYGYTIKNPSHVDRTTLARVQDNQDNVFFWPDMNDAPYQRMMTFCGWGGETVSDKLIDWDNEVMTIKKNNKVCVYNFNNWTFTGDGCGRLSTNIKQNINGNLSPNQPSPGLSDPGYLELSVNHFEDAKDNEVFLSILFSCWERSKENENCKLTLLQQEKIHEDNIYNFTPYKMDFNCDRQINMQDFAILLSYWNKSEINYEQTGCLK